MHPVTVPLLVTGGSLILSSGVTLNTNLITVTGGNLSGTDSTAIYANPLTMNGGGISSATFSGQMGGSGNFTIGGAAILSGTGTYTGTATFTGDASITSANALSAAGSTVVSAGNVSINAPLSVPLVIKYVGNTLASNVTVNGPVSAPIIVNDGTLNVNAVASQPITVNNGTAYINVPGGNTIFVTGSPPTSNGTAYIAGSVVLNTAGASPVVLHGGSLFLNDSVNAQTGAISINNGYLYHSTAGTSTLSGPLQISGNVTISTTSSFNINSPITASGFLTLVGGTLNFNAPLTCTGLILGSSGQNINFSSVNSTGAILLNASANFSAPLQHTGDLSANAIVTFSGPSTSISGTLYAPGAFFVNSNLSVAHLLSGGNLQGNGTISTSDNQITLLGGNLNFTGNFSGNTIAINGAATISSLPAGFAGGINVNSGQLQLAATLANSTVPINLVGPNTALTLNDGQYNNPINLNNSSGCGTIAALSVNPGGSPPTNATLAGPVNLGTVGSSIGPAATSNSDYLDIAGPISGGNLTIRPGLQVFVLSSSNSYTGTTTVLGNRTASGNLILSGAGAIHSTGLITLQGQVELYLDDFTTNVSNRIPDGTPIAMNGALVVLDGNTATGSTTAETVGAVAFNSGANTIKSILNNTSSTALLTLASLSRSPGATADFNSGFDNLLGTAATNAPRIMVTSQSAGFIDAAYTVKLADFAKYGPNGITAMSGSDYFTGPESAWTASTIVSLAPQVTLSGSRSVKALRPDISNSSNYAINLANYTLNVVSGGILGGIPISGSAGNHLTAGGSASAAELFLTNYSGTLSANITDNPGPDGLYDPTPGGPLDKDNGSVSLVFYGAVFNGNALTLTGTNTYSGTTYLNGGTLTFASPSALSHGDVVQSAGVFSLGSSFVASVGNFTLHDGVVGLNGLGSLNAASYKLESGQVDIPITGSGPLIKSTIGTVTLATTTAFTGPITVNAGLLAVPIANGQVFSNPLVIENGTFQASIASGGAALWRAPITLAENAVLSLPVGFFDLLPLPRPSLLGLLSESMG